MPIELQEYEAYIAGANIEYFIQHPEAIEEILFNFFIGISVRNYYRLENNRRKKRGDPPLIPEYINNGN